MTAVAPSKGGFFAIDARIWARVTACGMNESAAYLVLANGTGRNNKGTRWSTNAVMNYTGIGWERAKNAIGRLIAGGFIRCAESHTEARPCYELATYRELVDHEAATNPPAKPDYFEQELLSGLQAGRQPTNKTGRNRAERLCQRGLLCRDAQGVYKLPEPATEDSGDNSIWLPNEIVKGTTGGEESPVRRLRSAGCIWTLRLFVDLYSAQNLRDDGGISPRIMRKKFDRQKIGQQGAYTVWGFMSGESTHWWTGPFAAHRCRTKAKQEDESPAWQSLGLLQDMGLLSFVPYIFENDTDTAEPIHVYGIGQTAEAQIEREIGDAADRAARAMALPSKLEEAEEDGYEYFCPIPNTKPTAQMIGVARLTYRPRTRRTAEWFAELNRTASDWIETFGILTTRAESASFKRAANFA
jgi:hypothetical protein